jgi:hypothetical protein
MCAFIRKGRDGSTPGGSLGYVDGILYGATNYGRAYVGGTVFEFLPRTEC